MNVLLMRGDGGSTTLLLLCHERRLLVTKCHRCLLVMDCLNLACFTKTRVCSSCFGSTNSGTRLFTKTQICLSCFGSTNLGTLQVFNLRTAFLTLMFGCGFLFPLSSSHFIVPVHLGGLDGLSHHFGHDLSHSMHLANEFGLTALASVSSSRPPQLGSCCCR